jgi:hypothetical protein
MGANGATTYSFKDSTGAIISPLAGSFQIAGGSIGAGQFVVSNRTNRSEIDVSADGAPMTSYISDASGGLEIECQQTSSIHKFLLAMFNLHTTAAEANDVSNWAAITGFLRNSLDGSQHLLTGMSMTKIPNKTYGARGQMITWTLLCSQVTNL